MNGAEALTRLIAAADQQFQGMTELTEEATELQVASAVCQAMLNTMLPIARFRAHVEIDADQAKRTPGKAKLAATSEFTACSVSMDGIRSSLTALSSVETNVRISIWEQRANGADMLSGFQGKTKTQQFRIFMEGLSALEALPTVQ